MLITITIDTNNSAFHEDGRDFDQEVTWILTQAGRKLRDQRQLRSQGGPYAGTTSTNLIDANGNTVGTVTCAPAIDLDMTGTVTGRISSAEPNKANRPRAHHHTNTDPDKKD